MRDRWGKQASLRGILLILTALGSLAMVFLLRSQLLAIFTPLLLALVIAYILNPIALWLQNRGLSRTQAALLIYLAFFGTIGLLVARFLPLMVKEFNHLAEYIPRYSTHMQKLLADFDALAHRLNLPDSVRLALHENVDNLEDLLLELVTRVPEYTTNIAKAIFNVAMVLILTFYILKDFYLLRDSLYKVVPRSSKGRVRKILHEIDQSLGNYIRGQTIICSVVGFSTWLGLLVLGIDFALILGFFAGVTNIIPYFGPFIGAVPIILVALLSSPFTALKAGIVIVIVQQLESNLLSPQILGKSMGLHPLVVIIALLAGGQFFGIIGMITAVPVVAVGRILLKNLTVPPLPLQD
jgi:sporulation integral membrane protein YtvI